MHIFPGGSFAQLPTAHRGFTQGSTYGAIMVNNKIYVMLHFKLIFNSIMNKNNSVFVSCWQCAELPFPVKYLKCNKGLQKTGL
jgi:hypothetical protein